MNRQLHVLVLLATAAMGVAGCASSGGGPGEQRPPGRIAFERHCRTCHRLPRPSDYRDDQWPTLVERYGPRAGLSSIRIAEITEYLLAVNDAGRK